MSTARDDIKYLRVPLIIAALLVAIDGGVVWGMLKWTEQTQREQAQAQSELRDVQGKLARAREEEQEINRNLVRYRALLDKGIIGEENRLDWIERINAIRIAHKLYDIRSEMSEQARLDNSPIGPDIMVSRMKISLPMLHEDDLFQLLADLRASSRGYFQVKKCNLLRGAPADRRVLAPTMDAICELDFYTVRQRAADKVAGS